MDNDGANLEDIDTGDYDEDDEGIGHHGDDAEIGAESEGADVTHIKLGGLDVEPEEGDECSDDEHTNSRKDEESLVIGNEGVDSIIEEEKSTSETVETVGDIDRIGHSDDDEYEEGNIKESNLECPEERDAEASMTEFDIEPIGSESSKNSEENHLDSCRESLGPSDFAHIEIIVYESNESDTRECKEGEVGLISIPETVLNIDAEDILDIGCEKVNNNRNDDEWEDREENNTGTHYWRPGFIFMKFKKFCRLTHECLFADLLTELVSLEESDIWRDEYEGEEEWEEEIEEEKSEISHRVWAVKS